MKHRSQRYNINGPRPRLRHKYTKYKMCLSIMMFTCIKQHLNNIWSSIRENLSNTEADLEKSVTFRKSVYFDMGAVLALNILKDFP